MTTQAAQLREAYAARGARFAELARQDVVLGPVVDQVEAKLGSLQLPMRMLGIEVPTSLGETDPALIAVFADAIARTWTASQS